MSESRDAKASAGQGGDRTSGLATDLSQEADQREDAGPGGDKGEYQEEMAMAVEVFATRLQQAMLADLEEDKRNVGGQGRSKPAPRRPRRMEKLLQGLFEYIDALARDEAKDSQEEEELDEKGKGKEEDDVDKEKV
ncbi:hypothetical protein CALCODRAFT_482606 [Calocera cornea HHB12733]|uniref:Uncharacterized protein n=1 Tax=Calocera cornea HHB12733 TaxID=1353952 RepID=A0A165GH43_9BASI|nr:hypothetical protein CALCODRAFT_482606 [Calocera cornea HHB12733]